MHARCADCAHEKLVAFSCKRRGFCRSCGARRMAQSAAVLVDEVIPQVQVRQWVLSFPIGLRAAVVPGPAHKPGEHTEEHAHPSARIGWARLLKRVFDLNLEHCPQCGGDMKIIAAIADPVVIVKILTHLGRPARAPPRAPARRLDLFEAA